MSTATKDVAAQGCLEAVRARATRGDPASVLATIDAYATQQHWLMNVGPEKGRLVVGALPKDCKLMLEWGVYCGYSTVLLASSLPAGARLVSCEINPTYAAIAQEVVQYAGLQGKVDILVGDVPAGLATVLATYGPASVDCVFIDHWKDLYLPHLKELEKTGLLHAGSVLIADNVVTPGAPDYLAYVQGQPGRYSTVLHPAHLEYRQDVPDAVAVSTVVPLVAP